MFFASCGVSVETTQVVTTEILITKGVNPCKIYLSLVMY